MRQAGVLLDSGDKFLQDVQRLADHLSHINERWNNRLILENGSFWKRYLGGEAEIILKFDRVAGPYKYAIVVRIMLDDAAGKGVTSFRLRKKVVRDTNGNDRQKVIMLVLVTEAGDGPKIKVRVSARLNLIENLGGKFWEGSLYKKIVTGSFEVFSFLSEREMQFPSDISSPKNSIVDPVIQCFPEVVDGISHHSAKMFIDRLFGSVGEVEAIRIAKDGYRSGGSISDLIEIVGKRGAIGQEGCDMFVGPFDL